jgi:hypothetical protein
MFKRNSLKVLLGAVSISSLGISQSLSHNNNNQRLMISGKAYERNVNYSSCFSELPLPPLGDNNPNNRMFINSIYVYRYFTVSNHGDKDIVIQYGYPNDNKYGPVWNWNGNLIIPQSSIIISAKDLDIYYSRTDIRNSVKYIRLESINFINKVTKFYYEREYSPELYVRAVQLDDIVYFIWSDGKIQYLSGNSNSLDEIDLEYLDRLVPKQIKEIKLEDGSRIPQPIQLCGLPTISPNGHIVFCLNIREKIVWTREQMDAQWQDFPSERKTLLIKSGKWPIKESTYEGSDYIFHAFELDPVEPSVKLVDEQKLVDVTVRSPYVNTLKPKNLEGVYVVNGDGHICFINNLICPPATK